MARIIKSTGLNTSERVLAFLGEKSFLSLWSYPNVYRDIGKELCDLLVVCGDHVLIFSDKHVGWPRDVSTELAWSRWYRRAVGASAKQLHRAVGWVRNHPSRLFLDAQAKERFPIELPSPDRMQIHGIIVARGAAPACRAHFGSGSGSLALAPLTSRTRAPADVPPLPFFVGNPAPADDSVFHILDDVTLQVLLSELDTISDFTDYLRKRERLIAANCLMAAHGEEDLLATYLGAINSDGEHDFISDDGLPIGPGQMLVVEGGSYADIRKRGEYRRKKAADRVSYLWDTLIERFASNIINDTSYIVRGYEGYHEPTKRELGLRQMALVSRLERRVHSEAIRGAFKKIGNHDRFFRAMLPGGTSPDRSTGFFLLLLKRNSILKGHSDEEYRMARTNFLYAYAINLLRHVTYLERVIGIGTEGEIYGKSRSEDLVYAEKANLSEKMVQEADSLATALEIFKEGPPDGTRGTHVYPQEYPPSHHPSNGGSGIVYHYVPEAKASLNRTQRRAERARRR